MRHIVHTIPLIIGLALLLALTLIRHAQASEPTPVTHLERALVPVLERVLSAPNHETVDLVVLASVIAEASRGDESAAVSLVVQARMESHGSAAIQAGACKAYQCDPVGKGAQLRHRARGLWQVQRGYSREDGALWDVSIGLTREAMLAGATLAAKRLRMCKTLEGRYSAQSGKGCRVTTSGIRRARLHKRVAGLLAREVWRIQSAEDGRVSDGRREQ